MGKPEISTYYSRLGVDRYASLKEIKDAYKALALLHHPDRPTGNTQKFTPIQEAYEVLSDSSKRRRYDRGVLGDSDGHLKRLSRQRLPYFLVENPEQYDHYTYLNILFGLKGEEQFIKGQEIADYDELWERLHYVGYILKKRDDWIVRNNRKLSASLRAERDFIDRCSKKMGAIATAFCNNNRKFLYDLSLDIPHSEEMKAIEQQIGGRVLLIQHIKDSQQIDATSGVFALRDANCLTPANFKKLVQCKEISDFSCILKNIAAVNILTQANFDRLLEQSKHLPTIDYGLTRLKLVGLLNQKFFDLVVNAGKNACTLGYNIESFKEANILNECTISMLIAHPGKNIWQPLLNVERECSFLFQPEVLQWQAPQNLHTLLSSIDQMIAHGLLLLSEDMAKGKIALTLGLGLKRELYEFFNKTPEEQEAMKNRFKAAFLTMLHSKDKQMSTHRALWKVIIANIFIAFTCIGLFAIGANLVLNRQCFFAKTAREKQVEEVEKVADLVLP